MPNPTDLGRAIDVALKIMAEKLVSDKKQTIFANFTNFNNNCCIRNKDIVIFTY